jgi:16S rRNA (uracil1498-N3)-methyltransferase
MLFYQPEIANGVLWLNEDESRHCTKVLRKAKGDLITITDGKGFFYECSITHASSTKCEFSLNKTMREANQNFSIHIAIAPTKNTDRIEWFVEKATEVGIYEISLMECERSERSFIKMDRLVKVSISAMKQSQKATLPVINDLIPFEKVIDQSQEREKFMAFVDHSNPSLLQKVASQSSNYLLLVGPEGDFSEKELIFAEQRGFQKVSLGPSRLRTETAGLVACCLLNSINH